MNRYLLLILLSSWAHVVPLSLQCETGKAHPKHVLSVPRSNMANADVAVLKMYAAETLDMCITDCCTEKFGSCTVASFVGTNDTEVNCRHFNCRPIHKCIFLSSNSTDSFTFSSSPSAPDLVPSRNASNNESASTAATDTTASEPKLDKLEQNSSNEYAVTKETVTFHSQEHFALKNNTTIKPRKGVDDVTEISFENVSRSGIKPRKGVSFDGLTNWNNSKSKVKPRKGVGPFQSQSFSSPLATVEPSVFKIVPTQTIVASSTSSNSIYKDILADDIVSALEKVFQDESKVNHVKSSTITPIYTAEKNSQNSATVTTISTTTSTASVYTSTSTEKSSSTLQSSLTTTNSYTTSSSVRTPDLVTPTVQTTTTETFGQYVQPSSSRPSIFEHSKLLFHESKVAKSDENREPNSEESENQRKYTSSMHVVLSLVFGFLVLFTVLGVIVKRIYESWMRRHYRRMDFLIDGMYNGYG